MKNSLRSFLLILTCFPFICIAQNQASFFKHLPKSYPDSISWISNMYSETANVYEVIRQYESYYSKHAFEKNMHTQNYKHWLKAVYPYLQDEGTILYNPIAKRKFENKLLDNKKQTDRSSMEPWSCIGPFETYTYNETDGSMPVSWQVNIYCIDQSVSNPNIIYAGTEGQGAWKSIDKGLTWDAISLQENIGGVRDIKVAPSNEEVVFLSASNTIYKSLDGGESWLSIADLNDIYQIIIHPNNPDILYVAGGSGLYNSIDGGETWRQDLTGRVWDINFHPTKPEIVYALKNNSSLNYAEFYKTEDHGENWVQQTAGWYNPINPNFDSHSDGGALIAVTPLEPEKVYVAMLGEHKSEDQAWIGVYRSNDEGNTWENPIQDGGPYDSNINQNLATSGLTNGFSQYFYDFGFDASHTQPGKLYLGVLALSVSENGGDSWTRIGAYSTPAESNVGYIHPDIQDIHVLGSDVWVASDGGLNYSSDEFQTHESRKYGIVGSHFWGFDQAWNEDVMVGGRYHNGNMALYEKYGTGLSSRLGGGEAPTGYCDLIDPLLSHFSDIASKQIDNQNVGQSYNRGNLAKYPHQAYFHAEHSEIIRDPRYADHFYIGSANGDNQGGFWKTENNGASFELLYDFGPGKITGIEISRANPNKLYCVYNGYQIFRSLDGGISWQETTLVGPTSRMMISINPIDDDVIWVFAHSNNNAEKVFRSQDGGESWTNMTRSILDGHRINDGIFQAGSQNSRVYIVSPYALFYWDENLDDWIDYHEGLPFLMGDVKQIFKPFYRDDKIRLASVRGIWEAPFQEASQPIAQPVVSNDTVYCARDTIQLECYSVLNHDEATWQWEIVPEPLWISDKSIRNPKVVFGQNGAYDVSLMVTNKLGLSDTKSVPSMVIVDSECEVTPIPGTCMQMINDGDWVQIPDLEQDSVIEFTMSAWIKPEGIQAEYTGIIMNDDLAAGFNFLPGDNQIGYHWPGGAWWWNSGLYAPSEEWTHVALVAQEGSITIYVNGQSSTHTTNIEPVNIGTMKIGSYRGWGGRNYKGEIDEVSIWNRALSESEIRQQRHLTKKPDKDPSLLLYYQFNSSSPQSLDLASASNGSINGTAHKILSTTPVGGGQSQSLLIDNQGDFDFNETGLQFSIAPGDPIPNGEVYVSRLDLFPNAIPDDSEHLPYYWIINNYGLTEMELNNISLSPPYEIPSYIQQNPQNVQLLKRSENGFENVWLQDCEIDAIADNKLSLSTCNGVNEDQIFLRAQGFIADPLDGSVVVIQKLQCFGDDNGILNIEPIGGIPPYSYSLNGAFFDTSSEFSNLSASMYSIQIRDSQGSIISLEYLLEQPDQIMASAEATDLDIIITASGGTGDLSYSLDGQNYQVSNIFQDLEAGAYQIWIKDENDCTISITYNLMLPLSGTANVNDVTCHDGNDGQIQIIAIGGVEPYEYSLDGTTYQSEPIFSNLEAANYTLYILDNEGTLFTIEDQILSSPDPIMSEITKVGYSFSITASGGTGTFRYSLDGVEFQIDNLFSDLSPGIHTYFIMDENECIAEFSVSIDVEILEVLCTNITHASCFGGEDGSIQVGSLGGYGEIMYSLDNVSYQIENEFINLTAGNYTIYARDEVQQVEKENITINEPDEILVDIQPNGYNVMAEVNGGTQPYAFSLDGIEYQDENTFSSLMPGEYQLYIKDANGCIIIKSFTISVSELVLDINQITPISCFNGSDGIIEVLHSGGYGEVEYSLDGTNFQIEPSFPNLPAGIYSVTVKDELQQTQLENIELLNPTEILASAVAVNGLITVTASGGTEDFMYSLDNINYQSANTFVVSENGQYLIYIMDSNGCMINIMVEASMIISAISEVLGNPCFGDSLGEIRVTDIVGGFPPFEYSLDDFNYQADPLFTGLPSDFYTVYVSDINEQTLILEDIWVDQPEMLTLDLIVDGSSISCLTMGGVGDYEYSIDGGNSYQIDSVFVDLEVGMIEITVKDENGCTASAITNVSNNIDPSELDIQIVPNPNTGKFQVQFSKEDQIDKLIISDSKGRTLKVIDNTLFKETIQVDLSTWPPGIYFLSAKIKGIQKPIGPVVLE